MIIGRKSHYTSIKNLAQIVTIYAKKKAARLLGTAHHLITNYYHLLATKLTLKSKLS